MRTFRCPHRDTLDVQTATRVRVAAVLCVALGAVGATLLVVRHGLARPALLAACLAVALVGLVLFRRADGAESRKPGW